VLPSPQSFCTLHFLHTPPSFQKPATHAQALQPAAAHAALSGFSVGSHAAHSVLLLAVHALTTLSPTEHALQAVHLESAAPVHAVRNVWPKAHARWVHATHRSPDR
jgi:hypothetical protein